MTVGTLKAFVAKASAIEVFDEALETGRVKDVSKLEDDVLDQAIDIANARLKDVESDRARLRKISKVLAEELFSRLPRRVNQSPAANPGVRAT